MDRHSIKQKFGRREKSEKKEVEQLLDLVEACRVRIATALILERQSTPKLIDVIPKLTPEVVNQEMANAAADVKKTYSMKVDLHLGWLAETFELTRLALASLDFDVIAVTRRNKESTAIVFEEPLDHAQDRLNAMTSGVDACVSSLISRNAETKKPTAEVLWLITEVKEIHRIIDQRLTVLIRGGWRRIIVGGLAVRLLAWLTLFTLVAAVCYSIFTSQGSLWPAAIVQWTKSEITKINEFLSRPEFTLIERIGKIIGSIVKIISAGPIFLAVGILCVRIARWVLLPSSWSHQTQLSSVQDAFDNLVTSLNPKKS